VIAQDDRLMVRALRFIRDHFAQGITVSDVAEEVGTSRRTVERHFSAGMEGPFSQRSRAAELSGQRNCCRKRRSPVTVSRPKLDSRA
jgi:transcriptional regulator GlxA family with amidase domain